MPPGSRILPFDFPHFDPSALRESGHEAERELEDYFASGLVQFDRVAELEGFLLPESQVAALVEQANTRWVLLSESLVEVRQPEFDATFDLQNVEVSEFKAPRNRPSLSVCFRPDFGF